MPAILVVDDEPLIRDMFMHVLMRNGLTILTAANGVQALDKYRLFKDDIDLVICDFSTPGIDEQVLITRLLADRPDLPVILLSDDDETTDLGSRSTLRFLLKPFDLKTLFSTVHSLVPESRALSIS